VKGVGYIRRAHFSTSNSTHAPNDATKYKARKLGAIIQPPQFHVVSIPNRL
jgi:hypothetical protein